VSQRAPDHQSGADSGAGRTAECLVLSSRFRRAGPAASPCAFHGPSIGGDTDRRDTAELVSQTATLRRPPALLCATIAIYSRGTCLRHADCDAGLLAACRCHLVPPPATSADAACVAKTKCRNCTLCFFASPQGPKGYRAHGQNEIMHAYGPESTPIGRMYMCGCVCGCMHTCRGV